MGNDQVKIEIQNKGTKNANKKGKNNKERFCKINIQSNNQKSERRKDYYMISTFKKTLKTEPGEDVHNYPSRK